MFRHRRFGYLSTVLLALMMVLGVAAPVAGQVTGPAEEVVITAAVVDALEVEFPTGINFGDLPSVWDPMDYLPVQGILLVRQPARIVVSSSRPYEIRQGGDYQPQSPGPVYSDDFVLGFWDGQMEEIAEYPAEFTLGTQFTMGPYQVGYRNLHEWTFVLGLLETAMPVPPGPIRYELTLAVAQL